NRRAAMANSRPRKAVSLSRRQTKECVCWRKLSARNRPQSRKEIKSGLTEGNEGNEDSRQSFYVNLFSRAKERPASARHHLRRSSEAAPRDCKYRQRLPSGLATQ